MKNKKEQKNHRHARVKKNITTSNDRQRLVVFRSNKYIYAQIVDDKNSKTLVGESDVKSKNKNKLESAKEVGLNIAKKGVKINIKNVVFDRAGYKYHGRVKSLADGAREGGLVF